MKTKKLFMRWSNRVNFAVPFEVKSPKDINTGLTEFRKHCDDNAELHVFIPHGGWIPIDEYHVMAPGAGANNPRIIAHETLVRKDGLISEAISIFCNKDAPKIMKYAKKTFRTWATPGGQDYTECAMRDSLTILRNDLVANIRILADDDLIPSPSEENNPEALYELAKQYNLTHDFAMAYPMFKKEDRC